ncbi:TPA: cellulase family glycosylhydrolase [Klebsiella pneumoniae]|nr:cellulase family glycosylhydrolase [Klebsiella pneumoniae]
MKIYMSLILSVIFVTNSYGFEFGVCTHIESYSENQVAIIKAINDLQVTTIRDDISWNDVEKSKGIYTNDNIKKLLQTIDSLSDKKIKSTIILSGTNALYTKYIYPNSSESINGFANYVDYVSQQLRGKVAYYEIWNEWTLSTKIGDIKKSEDLYFELVKKASDKIRKNDPNAKILIGGINPSAVTGKYLSENDLTWMINLLNKGIMKYGDGISIHSYTFYEKGILKKPYFYFRYLDSVENKMSLSINRKVPIYITEIGIPSTPYVYGYDEKYISNYIKEVMTEVNKRNYIYGLWWYDLKDDGINKNNKEAHFGIYDFSFKNKYTLN